MSNRPAIPPYLIVCATLILSLLVAGGTVIAVFKPEAVATFVTIVTVGGATVTAFVGNFLGQRTVERKLEAVDEKVETAVKQTNGMLHRRDAEIERLTDIAVANNIDPTTVPVRTQEAEHGSAGKEV